MKDCLSAVGVGATHLNGSSGIEQEWAVIKRAYFRKVLRTHPDKGGDAAAFREVQAAFEVLRRLFDTKGVDSFRQAQDESTAVSYKGSKADFKDVGTPSWEFYAEAAKEDYATYRVEVAKSGRSRCQGSRRQGEEAVLIEKGALRVGFVTEAGTYGMWCRLCVWRVPSKIWLGLPDPARCRDRRKFEKALLRMNSVALCGMQELSKADRRQVVTYVMDRSHWTFGGDADKVRKKKPAASSNNSGFNGAEEADGEGAAPAPGRGGGSQLAAASTELVEAKRQFTIPVPGKGAPPNSLSGKTFVLTGTFPEIGGGTGLELGKARTKKMIQSFGGRVTSAVSGKTDVLVVGKDPGFGKVSKARKSSNTRLLGLHDLKVGIEVGCLEDINTKPMLVRSWSKGYTQRRGGSNSLALKASEEELAIAAGTKAPALSAASSKRTLKRPASALAAGPSKRGR